MYLWFPDHDCTIAYNAFINAGKMSCGLADASVNITNNLFYRTKAPISPDDASLENWAAYGAGSVEVHNNSFVNPGFYSVAVPSNSSVPKMNASDNFWGTTDESVIKTMIFDRNDDLASPGTVPYLPYKATSPVSN